jgi:hypothetical protein
MCVIFSNEGEREGEERDRVTGMGEGEEGGRRGRASSWACVASVIH